MKRIITMVAILGLGAALAAQDSGDFFSDSNDSVLQKARDKYAQRQETVKADTASDAEDARDAEVDSGKYVDIKTKGDPDEPNFTIEIRKRKDLRESRRRNIFLFFNFFDFWDIFDWDDVSVKVSPYDDDDDDDNDDYDDYDDYDYQYESEDDEEADVNVDVNVYNKAPAKPHSETRKAQRFPLVISFVPGLSVPFGIQDANFALGAIGSATRSIDGFSASGVFDIVEEELHGLQGAGVFSLTGGQVKGGQFSGVFNLAGGDVQGVQAAGVFNIGGNVKGFQGAGVFNIADDVVGFQGAGVLNVAEEVRGGQASGVINVAGTVHGTQIGLINIADDLYGIPIGLVNFTKNGIRDLGFWHDEADNLFGFWANGTNNFYTLVFAGEDRAGIGEDWETFCAGLGLGYRQELGPLNLDIDVSAKAFFGNSWRNMLRDIQAGGPKLQAWIGEWMPAEDGTDADGYHPWYGCGADWPYGPVSFFPMARVSLGVPIFDFLEVFGGMSFDIGIDGTYPVPGILRDVKVYSYDIYGMPVDIYPHFFWGVKF